ncbi:MAG: cytochrome b/b6 [Rhizobiales bacterium]|nr:cytochrome b/b6 [Hyphomicrobiales bacterium]
MGGHSSYQPKSAFAKWFHERLPIMDLIQGQALDFPTPKNLNYFWTFGGILTMMLGAQLLTGIVLAMHYTPHVTMAFDSIEHIRRDVNYGNIIQKLHANGASMFFLAVYIHIFRGMYYGSYKAPREILWMIGVIILLVMMATAFMGYVLPWGQMSFWGAKVITNLFSAIPFFGDSIVTWLWGGFAVDNPTLNRFYSLHYLLPFVLAGLVGLHIWALHVPGNNNPTGVSVKSGQDTVPFHPYYTMKDAFAIGVFLIVYCLFVFFAPDYMGHPVNYEMADPLKTPAHIVPEWYFLPFYAILRSIDNKLLGVIAMFASILLLLVLPWLDTSRVRSGTYRPVFKQFFWILVLDCLLLGYIGSRVPDNLFWVDTPSHEGGFALTNKLVGQIATLYYFVHFLIILPILGLLETPKPMPASISEAVLAKNKPALPGHKAAVPAE